MDINAWLGIGTFLVVIAGASFAFFNKFFLNPDYEYIEYICSIDRQNVTKIKIEKKNGKVNQVFCQYNKNKKCKLYEEYNRNCWVYEN